MVYTPLASMSELREQLRLAAPLALGNLGYQLLAVVDTAMLGRYSEQALAGAGIANALLWTFTLFGMGAIMGMDTLVPQAIGAGEHRRARALLGAGWRLAVVLGVPLTALALCSLPFMSFFGVQDSTRHEAVLYIFGRLPAIIPFLLFSAFRAFLQSYSVTRPLVVAVLIANLVNVAANALLIFGDSALHHVGLPGLGLPELGALGAAISTSIVTCVSLLICFIATRLLIRRQDRANLCADEGDGGDGHGGDQSRASWLPLGRSIFRLGWPVGTAQFAEVGVFALVATLAGRLGTNSAAAHQLAITVISFTFNGILGIGAATSVRVGLAVGAGDHIGARRAGLVGWALGGVFMGVSILAYLGIPESLARLMTDQPTVIAGAVPLLHVAAVFQLSDAIQAVGAGALRGAGDTRSPMWAHIIGDYVVGLSVGITCAFYLDMGAVGLWWGLAAGLSCAAVIVGWRFMVITSRPIARAE